MKFSFDFDFCNKVSKYMAIFALILLVFACFSPLIFTIENKYVDFSETGQIGDTIGGIMNPIVALAGVLTTFIAFLMQVNANKIQSEQINKSFNLNKMEHDIESRNALELLHVDIQITIKHIDFLYNEIDVFCKETAKRPTGDTVLHSLPRISLLRYQTIDRNLLFDAFQKLVEVPDKITLFDNVYSILDYYTEAVENIYSVVYMPFSRDIVDLKKRLPEDLELLSAAINQPKIISDLQIVSAIKSFNKNVREKIIKNGVMDVFEFIQTLNNPAYKILFSNVESEHTQAISDTNGLITQNRMLVNELRKASEALKGKEIYEKLLFINNTVEETLKLHTIESIQSEALS